MSVLKKNLVIIGGGFAGFWSLMSAIRELRRLNALQEINITLVSKQSYLTIRPRLYEANVQDYKVELKDFVDYVNAKFVLGEVVEINPEENKITIRKENENEELKYDFLILSAGSTLSSINIEGAENSFNVDDIEEALKLDQHFAKLNAQNFSTDASKTITIIGGGITGIEIALLIKEKLKRHTKDWNTLNMIRIVLLEKSSEIGDGFDQEGKEYIQEVLNHNAIEIITSAQIKNISENGIELFSGKRILTSTVILATGLVANNLTDFFRVNKSFDHRIVVNSHLMTKKYRNVIFTGDMAKVPLNNEGDFSYMSCQFALDLGKYAGYAAVNKLLNNKIIPYSFNNYVTCVDLGEDTAIYTKGWGREVIHKGIEAKKIKKNINEVSIYPSFNMEDNILKAVPKCLINKV